MTGVYRIGYIGNFKPSHSTENHVRQAFERAGHQVVPWQENGIPWPNLAGLAVEHGVDFVLWTKTWNDIPYDQQLDALHRLQECGIPTVGYHLDRWWGLDREVQIHEHPYFKVDLLITADGGHDDDWARVGVNHAWLPPAVLGLEAEVLGVRTPEFERQVGFVGSWATYHPEWPHRTQLISWLRQTFERHGRLGLWPMPNTPSIRGQRLADLYASVDVIIGDSCLAGGARRYWSDRIPETLGRGGFLLHPYVEGIEEHFTPDEHLVCYEVGDFPTLRNLIEAYLRDPDERARIAAAGRAHVLAHHTYERRVEQILALVREHKLIGFPDDRSGRVWATDGKVRAVFDLRADSTDALVVNEVWRERTYRLRPEDVAGRTVVDLGANVGAFTVWAAQAGAPRVHAVEPDPDNAAAFGMNVHANGLDRATSPCLITFWQGALVPHETGGYVDFFPDQASGWAAPDIVRGEAEQNLVRAWRLSEVLDRTGHDHLVVKCDIEGAEYGVIEEAMRAGAWARVDVLTMEFHGPNMLPHVAAQVLLAEGDFGRLVEALAEEGEVSFIGRPSTGGQLVWRRYQQ